jgi:uncharacterized protein
LTLPRLCEKPVMAFRADGSRRDLGAPAVEEIDFYEMAATLSKLPRFNAAFSSSAYSVAQHCVLGAEAMLRQFVDSFLAALFLLHDGHEYLIGDQTGPQQSLFDAMTGNFSKERQAAARGWDAAIYRAAGISEPQLWQPAWTKAVKDMDARMLVTEAAELSTMAAAQSLTPKLPVRPAFRGIIEPWGAAKAEMAFIEMAERLLGRETMIAAASVHAAHRALGEPQQTRRAS